ncbi:MAG: hypothetical protein WBL63_20065 [Candidatus Acidiferrum sp.]
MTSPRLLPILGIIVWAGVALTAAPRSTPHRHTVVFSPSEDSPDATCSDLHVRFEHHEALMQTEERTITRSEASTLRVIAESNGGIQVQGWDQDTYSVTLCKAAEAGSDADSLLSKIHLTFQSGELGVAGPGSHDRWSAHILIRAPKAASLDLHVNNGPLSLHHVDGNLRIRAENGPISVTDCTGELDLNSHNGPVTLEGNSGKQSIHTENGPVRLSLSGDSWNGSGIEAHATNGPVTLQIPSGYKSGVILESDGHAPLQCHADVCSEARKTWDDDRKRIEFGAGPTLVRVSTVNGPVSVH